MKLPSLRQLGAAVRNYPIPFVALAGLIAGGVLFLSGAPPKLGNYVWLATLLVGGIPLVIATVRRLLGGRFAADVIAAIAIAAAIALDQAFAGVIIVLMQSGGEALEHYAFRRASSSLEGLLARAPRVARRWEDGSIREIPVEGVRVGDRLSIRAGDIVPVDGAIASERASIDTSPVTGEPLPRSLGTGDEVLSGSVNVGPAFDLVARRPAGESQYARIVDLVRNAQERKPAVQRLADRYATWFTPATLVLAGWAWFYTHTPVAALAVLVVATPCPLILATPIAVIGAIDRASERGLVVKSGGAIEQLGESRAVLFDKTGTITSGRPEVERVVAFSGADGVTVLRDAGALELLSSHPLAASVVREAKARGVDLPLVADPHEFPGAGIAGTVDGHRVVVGSFNLCSSEAGRPLDVERAELARGGPLTGRLEAYVLVDGRPAGALVFADRLRPEAKGLAERLRSLGVRHVAMVTGDHAANAAAIAQEAGIPVVDADLLPEQKVARVGEARRNYGTAVMVGDGINDAAALAAASVGVAMGAGGAGISAEAADVVVLVDDVSRVADGIALGQRMLRVARQGILFGLGSSIVLMALASFGTIPPALGAVLQEVIDVAVIVNALRVRYGGRRLFGPGVASPSAASPA
jgi:heavy metal translocating P-type ATPase